jgi:surface antigen
MPASAPASPLASVTSLDGVSHAALVQAQATADQWWTKYSGDVSAMLHTGSGAGGCTDYVSARRPDVIERVEKLAVVEHVLANENGPVLVNWLAKDWASNARMARLATGKKPRRGAVLVFQPGAYGASAGGHVAIVDRVKRNGSFTISEEHAPLVGVISHRHFSARMARKMARDRRITFIYR